MLPASIRVNLSGNVSDLFGGCLVRIGNLVFAVISKEEQFICGGVNVLDDNRLFA